MMEFGKNVAIPPSLEWCWHHFHHKWESLDCEVLSRHCKSCTIHYPLRESKPAAHETWLVSHSVMSTKPSGVSSKYGKCC